MMITSVPVARGVDCEISEDGAFIALVFSAADDQRMAVAIPSQNIGGMVAHLINMAKMHGANFATPTPDSIVTGVPIDVSHIGVVPGRTNREALLTIQSGPLQQVFALSLESLLDTLRNLEGMTVRAAPQRPQ